MLSDGPISDDGFPFASPTSDQAMLNALIHAARIDFWAFIELMFPILHPGQQFQRASYLELMASFLMRVDEGKYKRLVINLPPRHMKSVLTSVLYPAWVLGRNPAFKFICISYSDELAHYLSTMTRSVMKSPLYRAIFPGTILAKEAQDHIITTKRGYRLATAVGSVITGFGADTIIVDDPMQPESAFSELKKSAFKKWLGSSVLTRFNNPGAGSVILVMHRLSQDDPSSDVMEMSDSRLVLPLIALEEENYTFYGRVVHTRRPGEVLNPALYPPETVDNLRKMLSNHVFQSQYQQAPLIGGSGMLRVETWPRYDQCQFSEFELLIQSWDIGATVNGNASVCTTWGVYTTDEKMDVICLVDVERYKLELPNVEAAIRVSDQKFKPALIVIDANGVGLATAQYLQRKGFKHLKYANATHEPIDREGDPGSLPNASKIARFGKAVLEIAAGRVFIPASAPWLDSFLKEIAGFPNIPDKDQVDSMSQIAGNLNRIIHLARREKLQRGH